MRSEVRKFLLVVRHEYGEGKRRSKVLSFDHAPTWQDVKIAFPNGRLAYLNTATGFWESTGIPISQLSSAHELLAFIRRYSTRDGFTIQHVEALLGTLGVWCFGESKCEPGVTACTCWREESE